MKAVYPFYSRVTARAFGSRLTALGIPNTVTIEDRVNPVSHAQVTLDRPEDTEKGDHLYAIYLLGGSCDN